MKLSLAICKKKIKKISTEVENNIVGLDVKGYSLRKIAEKVGVCHQALLSVITK